MKRKAGVTTTTVVTKKQKTGKNTSVAAQVKKAISRLAEEKRFSPGFNAFDNIVINQFNCWNPLYWISVGTNDSSRIGDSIFVKAIEINFTVKANGTASVGDLSDGLIYTVAIVKHRSETKDGSLGPSGVGAAFEDLRIGASGGFGDPILDKSKATVLFKRTVIHKPIESFNAAQHHRGFTVVRKYLKINQKFQFTTTNSGYGKSFNYYILLSATSASGSIATHSVNPNYVVYFTDM